MKRIFLILFLLAANSQLTAKGLSFDGGVDIEHVFVITHDNMVRVEMLMSINRDAVTKCQSISIIPVIYTGSEEAHFPYVLVNGKNKQQTYERRTRFRSAELVANPPYKVVNIGRKYRGEQFAYSAEIPRQQWMENAGIGIDIVLSSCADQRQYYAMEMSTVPVIAVERGTGQQEERPSDLVIQTVPMQETPKTVHIVHGTAYLDFTAGSSVIIPSYQRNSKELALIHEQLDMLKNDPNASITGLTLTGYASPEGRFSDNERLAYARAMALSRYLQERYDIPVRFSTVKSVGEDWDTLRKMVANSDLSHKNTVIEIIDSQIAPDAKESKLRRLAGGTVWRLLLDEMFPELRRVEYRVDYTLTEQD